MHRLAAQDPSHVRPPGAVDRGMRIAFLVGELMMNAVCGYPEDRAAFERQGRANCQEIFDPLGCFVSPMREQPVIAHANSKAAGDPPQEAGYEERRPCEEEQRCDSAYMEQGHESSSDPIDAVVLRAFFSQRGGVGFHGSPQVMDTAVPSPMKTLSRNLIHLCNSCVIGRKKALPA